MLNLEFKEPAAVLMVLGAASIGLAFLGTNPLSSGPLAPDAKRNFLLLGAGLLAAAAALILWPRKNAAPAAEIKPPAPAPEPPADPLLSKPTLAARSLEAYKIEFTDSCRADMERCKISKDQLILLVQMEFLNHVNYFLFDLEDYLLPVRQDYLVFLNKVDSSISFRGVTPCSAYEAETESWKDILALYRRASRLAYRQTPNLIVLNRAMFPAACRLHDELHSRLRKHVDTYRPVGEEPAWRARINGAAAAVGEADHAFHDFENALIDEAALIASATKGLELSLQHIHKILLTLAPSREPAAIQPPSTAPGTARLPPA